MWECCLWRNQGSIIALPYQCTCFLPVRHVLVPGSLYAITLALLWIITVLPLTHDMSLPPLLSIYVLPVEVGPCIKSCVCFSVGSGKACKACILRSAERTPWLSTLLLRRRPRGSVTAGGLIRDLPFVLFPLVACGSFCSARCSFYAFAEYSVYTMRTRTHCSPTACSPVRSTPEVLCQSREHNASSLVRGPPDRAR